MVSCWGGKPTCSPSARALLRSLLGAGPSARRKPAVRGVLLVCGPKKHAALSPCCFGDVSVGNLMREGAAGCVVPTWVTSVLGEPPESSAAVCPYSSVGP